jgi:heterodisulfide reductase subunit C
MLSFLQKKNEKKGKAEQVDSKVIWKILKKNKSKIKLCLASCVHCTLCAESCFLHTSHNNDPTYMPSHKMIHSIGKLYKSKGKVSRKDLEEIQDIVWSKCALCTRCYCPMHVNIPEMIALAREICRSQGIFPEYGDLPDGIESLPCEVTLDRCSKVAPA